MEQNEFRIRLQLEIQQTLLGKVTPNLRYVITESDPHGTILKFIYYEEPTQLEQVLRAESEEHLTSWMQRAVSLRVEVSVCPLPNRPDSKGWRLYHPCERY